MSKRAIIVAGMHRSGTSAVTRVLNLAGAALPSQLLEPAPQNPEGFWESAYLREMHDRILADAGMSWLDIRRFPAAWFDSDEARAYRLAIGDYVAREFADTPLFVIKDPRICLLMPLWRPILADLGAAEHFVLPVRHPLEVAASLASRDALSTPHSLLLWLRYLLEAERYTRDAPRTFVAYSDLLADWRSELSRMGRDLGLEWPALSGEAEREIDSFLSPRHRHTEFEAGELEQRSDVPATVSGAYSAALNAIARDDATTRATFESLLTDVDAADALLLPLLAEEQEKASARQAAMQTHIHNIERMLGIEQKARAKLQRSVEELQSALGESRRAADEWQNAAQEARRAAEEARRAAEETQRAVDESQRAVSELQRVVSKLQRAVTDAGQREAALRRDNRALTGALEAERRESHHLRSELTTVFASRSWRLTEPLRRVGRQARRLSRAVRVRRHQLILTPARGIEAGGDGRYRAVDDDPQFAVVSPHGRLPTERVLIRFSGRRADGNPLLPLVYVDSGFGFAPDALRIPLAAMYRPTLCRLPPRVEALRLDPLAEPGEFTIGRVEMIEVGLLPLALMRLRALARAAASDPTSTMRSVASLYREAGLRSTLRRLLGPTIAGDDYAEWVRHYGLLSDADRAAIRDEISRLPYRPTISVLMPVYNTDRRWLVRAIDSVLAQLYQDWELCIANDASTEPHVRPLLDEYASRDRRIRVEHRAQNGHISAASNTALAMATGDFVALLDHDDELTEDALYVVARELTMHPDTDLLFSDEDKIDERGTRHAPHFKSDWNPDLMLSQNAFSHLGVYRRRLVQSVGGFREGFEGSQDHDLVLRASERTEERRIRHVRHVLYHWRATERSTARTSSEKTYAWHAGRAAVADSLARQSIDAEVLPAVDNTYYRVRYALSEPVPSVALIVPTRDRLQLLRRCIDGLLGRTDYPDLQVLVVDNDSQEPATHEYLQETQRDPRFRVLRVPGEFNFSLLNNRAVAAVDADVVGLVNNDIDVIDDDWLREMVSHAVRPGIGAVGALLYYANDTIQHGGVIIGMGGVAGHLHARLARGKPGYFGRAGITQNLSAVTAACLVIRRATYLEAGGLDEVNLPIAFNDVDFCLRLTERGYRNVWTPFAALYHLESATRGSDERRLGFEKESAYMRSRWPAVIADDPYFNPNLSLASHYPVPAFPPRIARPWTRAGRSADHVPVTTLAQTD